MQSEGISREFSLPPKRETRLLLVSDPMVSDEENPSSLALTAGSKGGGGLLFLNLPLPGTVLEILFSLCVKGNLKIFRKNHACHNSCAVGTITQPK